MLAGVEDVNKCIVGKHKGSYVAYPYYDKCYVAFNDTSTGRLWFDAASMYVPTCMYLPALTY